MEDPTNLEPSSTKCGDLKAAVCECIARIDLVRREMEADQEEIDRLKAETGEILARLKAA
jgi:hypothetical protein